MRDLEQKIASVSGNELFDYILKSFGQIKDAIFDTYMRGLNVRRLDGGLVTPLGPFKNPD